jgi:hypothetical protein
MSPTALLRSEPLRGAKGSDRSQSHVTTDGQSASLSWCRAPTGTHDQMLGLRSDLYSMCRPVASSLTRGRVCHLSFVLVFVFVKYCNICTMHIYVQVYTMHEKQNINNIYMASVSPGNVQQIIHFLSPSMM